jgi:hypothetical protein
VTDKNLDVDDENEPAPKLELDYSGGPPISQPRPGRVARDGKKALPPPPKPTRWPWLLLLLIVGGGLALEKTPYGAFFRHSIDGLVHADERALLTQDTITKVHELLGRDTLDKGNEALAAVDAAVAKAPTHKPLLGWAAYATFAYELRFGRDASRHSKALDWLSRAGDHANARLADAAKNVLDKKPPPALSGDAEAKWLQGLAATGSDAARAFEEATKTDSSIRMRAAWMRALENHDATHARELATSIASESPSHIGARLVLGRAALHDAAALAKIIGELAPLEKLATAQEKTELITLRGFYALEKGDANAARAAFDENTKSGSGTQLNTLGLARALIALGKLDEARAALDAVSDPALATEVTKLRALTVSKPAKK